MSGVYVHIPFCRRKCLYCDFYSVGERLAPWPAFVDALCREASLRIPASGILSHGSPLTLYIGGGTPSLIPPDEFRRLSSHLLSIIGEPVEFTIEVNPDDVSPQMVRTWREAGVNRVSMGVQSLIDAELRAVGRRHSSADAISAFHMLREYFSNISLDLMFGLPGQTVESLARSLDGIIGLSPEHISVYSLMYEERTTLTRLRDSGKLAETPEEDSEAMFRLVCSRLKDGGYEHYEISNYAKPGFRSRHNSSYWAGIPYIGLGPGAHSYDGLRTRTANHPDFKKYLRKYASENPSSSDSSHSEEILTDMVEILPANVEILTEDELREEMIMTRLRTAEGLNLPEFASRFGESALNRILAAAQKWLPSASIKVFPNFISIPEDSFIISDDIISSLF